MNIVVTGGAGLPREMISNFFMDFYYVYILESLKDGNKYTGYTENLRSRFEQHNKGEVQTTKNRRPLKLIYFEECINRDDALRREKYLKTHYGKMFLKNRLISYLSRETG